MTKVKGKSGSDEVNHLSTHSDKRTRSPISRGLKKVGEVGQVAFDGVGSAFMHLKNFRSNLDNFAGVVRVVGYAGEIAAVVKGSAEPVFNTLAGNLAMIDSIGLFGTIGYFGGGKFAKDCKNFKKKFGHILGQASFGIANAAGLTLLLQKLQVINLGAKLPVFTTSLSYIGVGFAGLGTAFLGIDAAIALKDAFIAKKHYVQTRCQEGLKKAKLLRDVAILKMAGFTLDTTSKVILLATLSFKLGPAAAITIPTLGIAAIGFYAAATVLQGRADKIKVKEGPLAELAAKVDSKKGKLKSVREAFTMTGYIAETVDGAEKFSKFVSGWTGLVGALVKSEQTSQVFKGVAGAFNGVAELIGATAIISNIAQLFSKEDGKYIWQRSKLDFGNVSFSTIASFVSLKQFLEKSGAWEASSSVANLAWANVKNISILAAACFRLTKSSLNIYGKVMEIRFRANWIKAKKLENGEIVKNAEKLALKLANNFSAHYQKKLKKVEKNESSNEVKKTRYQSYINVLAASDANSQLSGFYNLKRLAMDTKSDSDARYEHLSRGAVLAADRTNLDLLAYKSKNGKRANHVSKSERNKSLFAAVNDVLLCAVVTTATVFMFTPVGLGAQLALAITGTTLNTVGFIRFFTDKRKPPKYQKASFAFVTELRHQVAVV